MNLTTQSVLRAAFAPVLFALLSGYANADGGDRAADNTLQFHCPDNEHILDEPQCPAGQARLLERNEGRIGDSSLRFLLPFPDEVTLANGVTLTVGLGDNSNLPSDSCGVCVNETALDEFYVPLHKIYREMQRNRPALFFGQTPKVDGGKLLFNGKTYYNADSTFAHGVDTPWWCDHSDACGIPVTLQGRYELIPLTRTNQEFCSDWFGGVYDAGTRECECPEGELIREGSHARCIPRSECMGDYQLFNQGNSDESDDRCQTPATCQASEVRSILTNECRLPAGNAECAGLNAGAEPIHDANEPDNCRQRDQRECSESETFVASSDPADGGGTCECVSPNVEINGVCEIGLCGAGEIQSQAFGRLEEVNGAIDETQYYEGGCVAEASCTNHAGFFILNLATRHPACLCNNASAEIRLDPQNTPDDITDDVCDNDCPQSAIVTREKCLCSDGVAGGTCSQPESAEECALVFTDGSQPIYDASEADNCRPRDQRECLANQEFTASSDPADGGGSCDQCERHEFSMNGAECTECDPNEFRGTGASCEACLIANEVRARGATACSCEDPHIPDSGECRLPTSNDECRTVGDGSAPIFDENEPTNCRAIESGTDCPAGHVLMAGASACTACNAPETPNTARDDCECPSEGHAVINGRCQVLAIAPSFHAACYAANWRMPIANSETPEDCRAAADTPEDVTACQSIGESIQGVNFIVVFEGVCANAGGCIGTAGRLTPEVVRVDSESNIVGSCVVAENCGGARGGLVNADNECRLPTEDAECARVNEDTPIHHEGAARNCVAACGANERHDDNGVCECDESTDYVNIADSGEPLNCQMACDMGEIRNTNDICEACGTNEVPNAENDACICANGFEGSAGSCMACTGGKTSQGGAACACPEDTLPFENSAGVCEASREGTCTDPRNTYNSGTNRCECPAGQTDTADGSACEDIVTCTGNLTPNAENECHCPQDTHFGNVDSCVPHAMCGNNEDRNAEDNTCRCADNFEGTAGNCEACTGGKTSAAGAACACPADTLPFENSEGMCEASREGTCTEEPRTHYNSETNECGCPQGQRLNAAMDACEAIPASGGGGGGGGAAAAIIAVPVILIGGYWLLGGFDYIDPTYNLTYQGENDNLSYAAQGGFDLNHGNLNSYARAIQENGDAVAYQSGISYKEDFYSLGYVAYESKSVYDYDLGARLTYGEGPWSISPTADAEFNYSANTEDWTTEAGAGLTAAWTSHKWNIRAHSAFTGDLNHGLDLEYKF